MKRTITEPKASISPLWKTRLHAALEGILTFSHRRRGQEAITRGESTNARTLLELVEQRGELTLGSLQLALPNPDDLEMLKLGCWTLLFLKSLFPDWTDVEGWVKEAAECATDARGPVDKQLRGYRIVCRYEPFANVLDFQIVRS